MHHQRVEESEDRIHLNLSLCILFMYHQRVEEGEERGKFEFSILFSSYVSPKDGSWGRGR